MTDAPVQLIVSAFPSEDGADQALDELLSPRAGRLVRIRDAATIRRDARNQLHIHERGDVGAGRGAGSGAALGAALGLFGGPVGAALGAGAGALIGGLAARLIDSGIPDARLRQLGEALQPGTSAIVVLVELASVDELRADLARAGGDALANTITADVAQGLASGREAAYAALAAGGAVALSSAGGEPAEAGETAGQATDDAKQGRG